MEKVNKSDVIFSKKQGLFDKWGKKGMRKEGEKNLKIWEKKLPLQERESKK